MRRPGVLGAMAAVLFPGLLVAAPLPRPVPDDASLVALKTDATEHDLYASFSLRDAFSDDVREKIATGLPVTFTYFLEVARRRPFWFDKVLVHKTVTTTVTYDTLTHQYSLAKRVNDEVTESSVAVNEAEMMKWMTTLQRVRLADPTAVGSVLDDSMYIRVKSRLQKKFILFFIPWDVETGWEKIRLNLSGEGTIGAR